MRRLLACLCCVLPIAAAAPAHAESFYRWRDSEGAVRVTREQPALGVPYQTLQLPDPIRWVNAPDMPPAAQPHAAADTRVLFKAASASVYGIVGRSAASRGGEGAVHYGSAVAISSRLAITNCHIIEDAGDDIYVGGAADEAPAQARLVAADYAADRCVISVDRMELAPVPGIRPFDTLEVGETVFAIGNPLRLERTLSQGLLSAKRIRGERRLIQTTAAISPGSSGGGLFDSQGNLLGITSYSLAGAQAINFAIPAEDYWK